MENGYFSLVAKLEDADKIAPILMTNFNEKYGGLPEFMVFTQDIPEMYYVTSTFEDGESYKSY